MNPERILIASEAMDVGRGAFVEGGHLCKRARGISAVQSAITVINDLLAKSWMELEAAYVMVQKAAWLTTKDRPCGAEANSAKSLAAEACYAARRERDLYPWRHGRRPSVPR